MSWKPKFILSQISFIHGKPNFFNGKASFIIGRLNFYFGKTYFTIGRANFLNGKLCFSIGRPNFINGRVNFCNGKQSFTIGRLDFFTGKMNLFCGKILDTFIFSPLILALTFSLRKQCFLFPLEGEMSYRFKKCKLNLQSIDWNKITFPLRRGIKGEDHSHTAQSISLNEFKFLTLLCISKFSLAQL